VTIIERSTPSSLIDQGAGIVVAPYVPPIIVSLTQLGHPSPMFEFFKEYNRSDKPWCKTVTEGSINVLKKDGSIKHVYDLKGMLLGGTSWELLYNSLRANFDGKAENGFIDGVDKKEGDGNARYLHGMQVLSLRDVGGEGVEVQCANKEGGGMTMTANLVVGADGASSAVRNLFLPEIKREHVGYVAWRGIVPKNQVSEATRECFRWPAFFYARGNQAVE
jgi:2-polyprenyl-6-methoxyphenol hydroxylase-like FAD-dependent oxidoreductase